MDITVLDFRLNTVDLIIILVFLAGVAMWGMYSGGRQKSVKDYFLGATDVPWWAVCFSIVAAETSTLTFISIPGLAYIADLNFIQVTIGYLLGRIVVAFILLPEYFKGELSTAYSFLENRFGSKTRSTASITFMLTRTFADGVRLFATAIPLKLLMGTIILTITFPFDASVDISYPLAIIIIAAVSFAYTYTGGVKGVIWVDAVQMFVYIGGAVVSILFLLNIIPGGWDAVTAAAAADNKFQIFNFGFENGFSDFMSQPYTLIGGILGGAFLSMASHGTDQLIVQRLLATNNLKSGRKAIIGSGIIVIFQFLIFMILGVMLYTFFGETGMKSDEVFPFFIINNLPVGVTGLIIAGLFAAAMSTIAGSMSSLSSSFILDIYLPYFGKKSSDARHLTISRRVTLIWAVVLIIAAMFFLTTSQAVVEIALSIASFTYGGLLGTFLLGVLNKNIKQREALIAFFAGIFVMIFVVAFSLVGWTWFTLVGVIATLTTGYTLSAIMDKK